MLILRIRQAECAIADGRLDEAVELAQRHDVQSHRRGQRMLQRLVKALVGRAQTHLKANRPADAAADAEKARRFGGLMPEVADLRSKAAAALLAVHRAERAEARLVAAAREQLDRGNLSTGQKLLADAAAQESTAGVMLRDVHVRREALATAVANAEAALDRDDWESALRQLARVHRADAVADAEFDAMVARLGETVRQRARTALNAGDVRLAGEMLDRLSTVDGHGVETRQLADVVAQCRLAWEMIDRCQPRQAEQVIRRLTTLLPRAKWLGEVGRQLHQASESIDELRASPLGLCGPAVNPDITIAEPAAAFRPRPVIAIQPASSQPPPLPSSTGEAMPTRFLLQLDGAGSYLVVTSSVVNVGPVSSSVVPDVGLMTDASAALARIERVEEDYFLRASGTVIVNGRPCAGKLLNAGDEVALSPRCRLTFRVPSAASTSAVLDLTGARYPRADVRRVILLDRELVIGPGAGAHVRVDDLTEKLVLVLRDGRLFAQTSQPVLFAGRDVAPGRSAVPLGMHVKAGLASFVVTRA